MKGFSREVANTIIDLSGTNNLSNALRLLGLIHKNEDFVSIEADQGWFRSGAETYCIAFSVNKAQSKSISCQKYIIKACTPFCPALSIDTVLDNWVMRRKCLQNENILVPKLIHRGKGLIIENYIPYALDELAPIDSELKEQINYIANVLSKLRFSAINPFTDLRSDGSKIYFVDFGEDLGNPYTSTHEKDYIKIANNWIQRINACTQ